MKPHPKSYKGDTEKAERRRRVAEYWRKNPTATRREVAEVFGISASVAGDMKPHDVRAASASCKRSPASLIREAWERKALKLYYADAPIEEIAAATGRAPSEILRFIQQNTTPDVTIAKPDHTKPTPEPAPAATIWTADAWIEVS